MPLTTGTRLGTYEIIAPLGVGGMGEVYRARDLRLQREVAIKVLPASFAHDRARLDRFEREARVLASLNHPNIAQIYGLEESGETRALVMELVPGDDLSVLMARGPMSSAEAVPIAHQIAEALEAAHESAIVHRDLKPANVKVRRDGAVKVLDFGLAKAAVAGVGDEATSRVASDESPTVAATVTSMGLLLGTAAYMSPEQARGLPVDRRTDIWAFGVVSFEMLSGRRLFTGETTSDLIAAVLRREIDWTMLPATTPEAVRRLIARCLHRDVKNRLQAIGEARVVLEEAARNSRGDAAHGTAMRDAGVPPASTRWAVGCYRRLPPMSSSGLHHLCRRAVGELRALSGSASALVAAA